MIVVKQWLHPPLFFATTLLLLTCVNYKLSPLDLAPVTHAVCGLPAIKGVT